MLVLVAMVMFVVMLVLVSVDSVTVSVSGWVSVSRSVSVRVCGICECYLSQLVSLMFIDFHLFFVEIYFSMDCH